jgi:hypothetical protein
MGKSVCNLSIRRYIMTRLNSRGIVGLLLVFSMSYPLSCAHREQIDPGDTEVEIWELQLTGETQGIINMLLKKSEIENGVYSIVGKLCGKIDDHIGGKGEADYKLEGRIEGDFFKASFSGHSEMAEGPSYVNGSMNGTIFESQGSGSWSALHSLGPSTGKYAMKKIRPSR